MLLCSLSTAGIRTPSEADFNSRGPSVLFRAASMNVAKTCLAAAALEHGIS